MKNKWVRHLVILSAAIVLTGCASFRNNEVAKVESLPDVSQYQNKPSVFVEVLSFRGKPDDVTFERPFSQWHAQGIVDKVLGDSGLFSKYSFDNADRQTMDYILHINIYNHGDTGQTAISAIITGATFFIVPGSATDHYTLKMKLTDNTGELVSEAANEDSFNTWFGVWFIPVMLIKTPSRAFSQTLENQLKAALKELLESGKLKYSQNFPHTASHMLARR